MQYRKSIKKHYNFAEKINKKKHSRLSLSQKLVDKLKPVSRATVTQQSDPLEGQTTMQSLTIQCSSFSFLGERAEDQLLFS